MCVCVRGKRLGRRGQLNTTVRTRGPGPETVSRKYLNRTVRRANPPFGRVPPLRRVVNALLFATLTRVILFTLYLFLFIFFSYFLRPRARRFNGPGDHHANSVYVRTRFKTLWQIVTLGAYNSVVVSAFSLMRETKPCIHIYITYYNFIYVARGGATLRSLRFTIAVEPLKWNFLLSTTRPGVVVFVSRQTCVWIFELKISNLKERSLYFRPRASFIAHVFIFENSRNYLHSANRWIRDSCSVNDTNNSCVRIDTICMTCR